MFAALPRRERQMFYLSMSNEEAGALRWDWDFWARPQQQPPDGDWLTWLILAGRGFGKTETGAQWVRRRVVEGAQSIALVAETQKDLEEVMVNRIVSISPPDDRPAVRYKPVRLRWPSGATALGYNGTEPNQLRGPEFDTAWVDELAKYRYAQETWDMLMFTMRAGSDPRVLVSTTPRPIPVVRDLSKDRTTVVTPGSTFDNAGNLPPQFLSKLREKYHGTRLGRQELYAEILDDAPGALWTRRQMERRSRPDHPFAALIGTGEEPPDMIRVVVAVDPSGTSGEEEGAGDDIGIVVVGLGREGHAWIMEDATCQLGPAGWGRVVVDMYNKWGADAVIGERNFGGAMVEHTIRTVSRRVPYRDVVASRGKVLRAEPVSALYEQGRIRHLRPFPEMEDQMCSMTRTGYLGRGSPDRMDAMVWGVTELMLSKSQTLQISDAVVRHAQNRATGAPRR